MLFASYYKNTTKKAVRVLTRIFIDGFMNCKYELAIEYETTGTFFTLCDFFDLQAK